MLKDINRKVLKKVNGKAAVDGNGVHLVRVLGNNTAKSFDPILMLDSFDSRDPKDYIGGFPMHPHRGIETITFLKEGKMKHKDSLGNEDVITGGSVQWMTAGSGIFHEEEIPASDRMLGVQIWLNLPAKEKVTDPEYYNIREEDIPQLDLDGGYLRVISGDYKDIHAFQAKHSPLKFYHLYLEKGKEIILDDITEASLMAFTLQGNVEINSEYIEEKTAVKFSEKGNLEIKAKTDTDILILASEPLKEDIYWGGPVVMDTRRGLEKAFEEMRSGNFIKKKIEY